MTARTREILKNTQVELPVRRNTNDFGPTFVFRGDEFIDAFEMAIIKSPELKRELKVLINEILQ